MFVVPKPEGDKKENRFEFKIGTKARSIPFIQFLGGIAAEYAERNISLKSEVALMKELAIIECPDAEDEIRGLSADQAKALIEAWGDASNASVGESSASDDSE